MLNSACLYVFLCVRLVEAILMSTHNISFYGEMWKIIPKTVVTLTKLTVGRWSVGLIGRQSADFVPIFSFFFFSWLTKKKL